MQNLELQNEDRKKIVQNINKVIGQLESAKKDILEDHACEETLYLLMAARGATNRVAKDLIQNGILKCISNYSPEELESAIKILFKLD